MGAQVRLAAIAMTLASAASAAPMRQPAIPPVAQEPTATPVTTLDPRTPLAPLRAGTPYAASEQTPAPVTTLSEAIAFAYGNNPRLLAQRATLRATDHKVPQAMAGYGPSLNVTGTMGYTTDRNDSIFGTTSTQRGWANSASAILTQPLLTFGRNTTSVAVAQAQVRYVRAQTRLLENQVMQAVINDYVEVLRDAAAVTIARQNTAILEKQFADDRVRAKVHDITVADLDLVESRMSAARGNLAQAQAQLAASQAQFLRDVGAPAGDLAAPDLLHVPVRDLEDAYRVAEVESPVMRAAQEKEKISRSQMDAAKADFLPRVDFRGTASVGTVTPYNDALRTNRLAGEFIVTVPILDGGRRIAQLGETREGNDADWLLIDAARRETRAAVATAWEQISQTRRAVAFYHQAAQASRRAYEGAQLQHLAGDRTTLDVLDMARDLLLVETNANTALANEYLARASLALALGRLEAHQLVADTPQDDPDRHARRANAALTALHSTPMMALDGIFFDTPAPDRLPRDPAANQTQQAQQAMPPEDADSFASEGCLREAEACEKAGKANLRGKQE